MPWVLYTTACLDNRLQCDNNTNRSNSINTNSSISIVFYLFLLLLLFVWLQYQLISICICVCNTLAFYSGIKRELKCSVQKRPVDSCSLFKRIYWLFQTTTTNERRRTRLNEGSLLHINQRPRENRSYAAPFHAIICNTQFIWSLIYLDLVGLVRESLVVADPQTNTITHTSWISTPFRSDCLVRSTTRNMLCIVGQYQTTIRWGCGHIPKMCNFVVVVGCFCVPCHWAWRFSSQMCVCVYNTSITSIEIQLMIVNVSLSSSFVVNDD